MLRQLTAYPVLAGVLIACFCLIPASAQDLLQKLVTAPPPDTTSVDPELASGKPASEFSAVDGLQKYLTIPEDQRPSIDEQAFAQEGLSKDQTAAAQALLWIDHANRIRRTRAEEMANRVIQIGELSLPFDYTIFGEKPHGGRSLFISMHGGGSAPKQVNDRQWENQKKLYQPEEGIYLSPRGPTDTWNLWHQDHIDSFFDRLIENLIVLEDVNPDRVFLMGYSAGGDGVYQLAPRMADRFAAAAMMAGHPNEASPLGLRNLPFSLQVGADDSAYQRNTVAAEWEKKLADLQSKDPAGYVHWVKIHAGKGHWMDREDAAAVPWMAKHTRNALPEKIVWYQDDVTHQRFYWLATDQESATPGCEIRASRDGQRIEINAPAETKVTVLLNDQMLNLDQDIQPVINGSVAAPVKARRTIRTIYRSLADRGDPKSVFSAELNY